MAMGTGKQREKQEGLWIAQQELASAPGHPFYQKLNELLEAKRFDEFVEKRCAKFYAVKYGRPSLTPGIYFRALLIGYFEGIGAERGIAWRLADSLALRRFVGIALDEYNAGSLDDLAHAKIDRCRYAWRGVRLGAGRAGRSRAAERPADRDRRDDAGGQRGDALDRAAGHGRELRGVSARVGEGVGDRDADARRPGAVGPQAQEAYVE
jgi:hypothetical protein